MKVKKPAVREHMGGLVVVRLSWLSGRALVAQARGVLSLTPHDSRPSLFSPHNIQIHCFVSIDL